MIILPIPVGTPFARTSRLRWPSNEEMASMAEGQFFVTIRKTDPPLAWTAMFFRRDTSTALGWDFITSKHASTRWGIYRLARKMIAQYKKPAQFEIWK